MRCKRLKYLDVSMSETRHVSNKDICSRELFHIHSCTCHDLFCQHTTFTMNDKKKTSCQFVNIWEFLANNNQEDMCSVKMFQNFSFLGGDNTTNCSQSLGNKGVDMIRIVGQKCHDRSWYQVYVDGIHMQTSLRNLNHNLQQLNTFCSKIIA